MSRRSWIVIAVVAVLVVAGLPAGFLVLKHRQEAADATAQRAAAQSFAQAWKGGTLSSLTFATGAPADVAVDVQAITGGLTSAAKDAPADVVTGAVTGDAAGTRTVALTVTWKLAGDRVWTYPSSLTVSKQGDTWLPRYAPSVVHPKLVAKATLKAATQTAARGTITGADDAVLVKDRPVVVVGLQPSRADNIKDAAEQIADIVEVDGAALAKRAAAAKPDAFVEAITLRDAAYRKVRDELQPIPGAVFAERSQALAPTSEFARALLGTVGQATAEIVEKSEGRVQAGDLTGLSGVQAAYDETLAGRPGLAVTLTPPSGDPQTLFSEKPVDGKPLKLTLDPKIQRAADTALAAAKKPSAMVAIRVSTGEVLAVANGGPNGSGYNRALLGKYPPGSTFKVVSGLGLLGAGVTAQTQVACPATLTVNGKVFKNAEDEVLGTAPFHRDFAESCNTAFIGSATKLSPAKLAATAKSLGYGQPNKLGVDAFIGSVPTSDDPVEHAASMIGQGKVEVSPVEVAGASAAVANGSWHAPTLVVDPDLKAAEGTALPAGPTATLKELMREVVTNGTGTGVRSVPGGPVSGKTGTAQYGIEDPPEEHAWFTGFQGDIAFAVVVEGGGFGAVSAVPLTKIFLTEVAG